MLESTPKTHKISLRSILSVLTLVLVAFIVYQNLGDIKEAIRHLGETNIFILLLLIPEQLLMYYCCGQMFFSYMASYKSIKRVSAWELMRISLELNFVNHAIPAGGLGGLGYITWRFKSLGVTAGQASFMYALRYAITVCANQLQTLLAILALLCFGAIPTSGYFVIVLATLLSVGIVGSLVFIIAVASHDKTMAWFSRNFTRFCNWFVTKLTFGRRTSMFARSVLDKYLLDIHDSLNIARRNKRKLVPPIVWGIVYSFLEIATYWIVAASLGHPDLLPQIMVGEAIGSVAGAVMPYGLYELGMAGVMVALGVPVVTAGAVVVMTRVIVLAGTILSGYGFYQYAISKIHRDIPVPEKALKGKKIVEEALKKKRQKSGGV